MHDFFDLEDLGAMYGTFLVMYHTKYPHFPKYKKYFSCTEEEKRVVNLRSKTGYEIFLDFDHHKEEIEEVKKYLMRRGFFFELAKSNGNNKGFHISMFFNQESDHIQAFERYLVKKFNCETNWNLQITGRPHRDTNLPKEVVYSLKGINDVNKIKRCQLLKTRSPNFFFSVEYSTTPRKKVDLFYLLSKHPKIERIVNTGRTKDGRSNQSRCVYAIAIFLFENGVFDEMEWMDFMLSLTWLSEKRRKKLPEEYVRLLRKFREKKLRLKSRKNHLSSQIG